MGKLLKDLEVGDLVYIYDKWRNITEIIECRVAERHISGLDRGREFCSLRGKSKCKDRKWEGVGFYFDDRLCGIGAQSETDTAYLNFGPVEFICTDKEKARKLAKDYIDSLIVQKQREINRLENRKRRLVVRYL